ncbi:DMT family transporter [Planktothrix mougeotii LEGE 06226]|uniref:DMT family transporter n=2 Tax=Planktothrix mougeotii TaxID=54306 RepID=A0ABR9U6X5_9CYAN|nr:DMT family transporter [Planktothrix mougeotii]MBE9142209.1 DMT family transporter [Planktothrix mougeotii LEGE 06226]
MQRFYYPSPRFVWGVVIVGVMAISVGSILVRLALNAADQSGIGFSLVMAAIRLTGAALIVLPTALKVQWRSLSFQAFSYAVAAGCCLAFHFATWITSLSYTSIAASTTLVTTTPIWVAILSRFWLKEKLSSLKILGIAIAFLGGIMIGLSETQGGGFYSNPLLGNSLALIGAWAVSFYLMFGREAQQRGFSVGGYVIVAYTVASMILLPLPLMLGVGYTDYPATVYLYLLLMAIVPQLVGHTSFNWAINQISPTLVTLAILLEPMGASFLGYLFFNEVPPLAVLIGGIIVLTGVAIAVINSELKSGI